MKGLFRRRQKRRSISARKAERALFFWTARESLALTKSLLAVIFLAVLTVFSVIAMLNGELAWVNSFPR